MPLETTRKSLHIDLTADTGAIRYGATGFLYGLSQEGIPTDTMLAALKPQVLAQKAPDGIQHPGGDALKVAPQFLRNGGKEIQIYMQDFYASWPYPYNIEDYLSVAADIARKVISDPNRDKFVYVPLNEPDSNGYNKDEKLQTIFEDWLSLYTVIRGVDPSARIAGPAFGAYDSACYGKFLTFCLDKDCLPDEIVWHELDDNFYTNWYGNIADYRALEASRGIAPRPVVINEYIKNQENLPIPGVLVQWITRFETSKVDACLAYWCKAGGLNDLVTWSDNQATGGWWVFKWYGEMTGHTVAAIPPDENAQGLSGLASLDREKKQVRVMLGGTDGSADVRVTGFSSAFCGQNSVNVTVWGLDNSGRNVSQGPYFKQAGNYRIVKDQLTVALDNLTADVAYFLVITPDSGSSVTVADRYEAEYARLSGTARVCHGDGMGYSGTGYVELRSSSEDSGVGFVIRTQDDGYCKVTLGYSAGPIGGAPADRRIRLLVNGAALKEIACAGTADWNVWNSVETTVFLQAGINRIGFHAGNWEDGGAVHLDYIDTAPVQGCIAGYEAEAPYNTLGGKASRACNAAASAGQYVTNIGAGASNYLQFNNIFAPRAGVYKMIVQYANNETGSGAGDRKYTIVDRYADIRINGGPPKGYYFRFTDGESDFRTKVIDVALEAGNNSIRFSNSTGYVDLATVPIIPPEEQWFRLEVRDENPYRYLRYRGPEGSRCDIAEMEFYDAEGQKLTGTPFGTTPAYSAGAGYDKASDGNIDTAFVYAGEKCGYTGIDLGEGNARRISFIRFYPRRAHAGKMIGGRFQGSNDNLYESCWAPDIDKLSIAECEKAP
jgi:hypothetical protein